MNNKKMDIINDMEFTSLFLKSKNLIDNARSNMDQRSLTLYLHILQKNTEEDFPEVMLRE